MRLLRRYADQPYYTPEAGETLHVILLRVEELARMSAIGDTDRHSLDEIRRMVALLPLNCPHRESVAGRLDAAARYLARGEPGAARYELRLLAVGLREYSPYSPAFRRTA